MSEFRVMLAKNYDPKRVDNWKEIYVDAKLNGVRVIVEVPRGGDGAPRYYSRNGRELGMFTHLNPAMREVTRRLARRNVDLRKSVMFDAEAVGMTFGDVSGAIHTKGAVALTCRLHVFHTMPWLSFKRGIDSMSQIARINSLHDAMDGVAIKGVTIAHHERVLDHRQVMAAHRKHRYAEYEGTMVKNMHIAWTAVRSWAWMKIKDEQTVDIEVVDLKEGNGKYVGMCGALICDYKGRRVRVSGMTDKQRKDFWDHPKKIKGRMVEVEYQEETEHGSLRHGRFVRVRDDKE